MAFDPDAALAQLRSEAQAPAVSSEGDFADFDPDAALETLRSEQNEAQFGSPGQQLRTGVGSALDMLTMGGSTTLAVEASKDPEGLRRTIRGLEKANPKAKVTGQVAGVVVPAVLTMGESAVAQGAKMTAPNIISALGKAAGRATERALPRAESALGRAAVKAVEHAATGVVEGTAFDVGNIIHERALGDPNLTAQSALEEVGISALLGGGIGAGAGIVGSLGKSLFAKANGAKLSEWLTEFEGERGLKAAGAIQSDISRATKNISREELNAIGREAGEMGLLGKVQGPARTLEKATERMELAGEKMGRILDAADGAPGVPKPSIRPILNRLDLEVLAPLENNPLQKSAANSVREMIKDYELKFAPELGRNPTFRDLHGLRKQISDKLYGLRGVQDAGATETKVALHDFRTIVSEEIDKQLQNADVLSLRGSLTPDAATTGARAWKEANREYQVAATIQRLAEKGADRAAGNNPLGLLSVIMGAAGFGAHGVPGGAGLALGSEFLKRYGSGIANAAARAVRKSNLFGAIDALAATNEQVAKRVADLSGSIVSGAKVVSIPQIAHDKIESHIGLIQGFAANPAAAVDKLAAATGPVDEHAPEVAQAMQVAAVRAASFLSSKIPAQPSMGPLGKKLPLNEAQKWQFGRYRAAVEKPTSILAHASAGTLMPMDVEAVKAVHPQLLQSMQAAIIEKLTARRGDVPYKTRLMMAMILGQPLDATMTPEAIRASQATFAMPSQRPDAQPSGAVRPSQTGLSKLKAGQRAMTPSQAADVRMNSEA